MNKNAKKVIISCLTLVVMGAAMTGCGCTRNKETSKGNPNVSNNNQVAEQVNNDEFIRYESDGTRVNISPNIANTTKKMGVLEFKNIRVSEIVNMTKISADVYNTSPEKIIEKDLLVRLLDKNGNVIIDINATLGTIEPGASVTLNAQATLDFANAYDIQFVEKSAE